MSLSSVQTPASDRSIGDLLHDLSEGSAQLIRQEIRLARTETAESIHRLGGGAVQIGTALVLGICATGSLVACLIMALSEYVLDGRTWLAAFIVGLVLAIVAFVCVRRGMSSFSSG